MKLISKKRISLLLSLIMIITSLPLAGISAFAENSSKFEYLVFEDGTAGIFFYHGNEETVVIPSEIDGYTVTAVSYMTFKEKFELDVTESDATEADATEADATEADATAGDATPGDFFFTDNDFHNRDGIKKVIIPATVDNINPYLMFDPLYNLEAIEVEEGNEVYSSQDGVLFNKDKTVLLRCPEGKKGEYEIPSTVTDIYEAAFWDCDGITGITIPESITAIKEDTFYGCDGLTTVEVPVSVEKIDSWAFDECLNLTDIYILNRKCNIGENAVFSETTVHGFKGSTAESYANEAKNKFEEIPITISDAKIILQNVVNLVNFTEAQAKAADLDNDGKVTIVDAKWVLQIVVKLRDPGTLELVNKK